MRKFIVFVLFVVAIVSTGYGQGIPKEIKMFVENHIKDSTTRYGVSRARRMIPSIHAEDLSVRILEMYKFKHVFLDVYPDTVDLSEIIKPSGYWRILVMAHNKPLYELYLDNSKGIPEFVGMASLPSNGSPIWDPLLKDYPESAGINPVLFSRSGIPFIPEESFFYFKQKGPRKIRYLGRGRFVEPLLKNIDDSRQLMGHWKKQGLNEVGISGYEYRRRH